MAHRFTWTIGMDKMFNGKPPVPSDNLEQSNTYPSTYDVYERRFCTSVKVGF